MRPRPDGDHRVLLPAGVGAVGLVLMRGLGDCGDWTGRSANAVSGGRAAMVCGCDAQLNPIYNYLIAHPHLE